MKILAFESSCDETAVAVVEDGRTVLSDEILSQVDIHREYGGVVPEIASRAHIEAISPLCSAALKKAGCTPGDIDAVAVTSHPGLVGALLVAVNFAKSLAYSLSLPLIAVDHIRGHVAANYIAHRDLQPPFIALVMSGGHTSLINVASYTDYQKIGATLDDAAGEAFDKVARVMGMSYPGGREMDALAALGNADGYSFPTPSVKSSPFDFSFSGIKTAVINKIHNDSQAGIEPLREDIAASFTKSVCLALCDRVSNAIDSFSPPAVVLGGGVCANSHIRRELQELCRRRGVSLFLPPPSLCGDNAAMIGAQAYYEFLAGNVADISLNAVPTGR